MRKHFIYLISALVICLAMAACSTKQKAVKSNTQKQPTQSEQLVEAVLANQPQFASAFSSRARLTAIYQQRQVSASASISIITDSLIVVSVQPILGIELLRADISQTDITIFDKMNRRYSVVTFEQLQARTNLNITFSDVQALLTQHLFALSHDNEWLRKTRLTTRTKETESLISFVDNDIKYQYEISNSTKRINKTVLSPTKENAEVEVTYTNLQEVDEVLFPMNISIDLTIDNMDASCQVELQKVQFNQPVKVQAVDIRKLSKVNISTIIPM